MTPTKTTRKYVCYKRDENDNRAYWNATDRTWGWLDDATLYDVPATDGAPVGQWQAIEVDDNG